MGSDKISSYVISEFKGAGLVPLNKEEVLKDIGSICVIVCLFYWWWLKKFVQIGITIYNYVFISNYYLLIKKMCSQQNNIDYNNSLSLQNIQKLSYIVCHYYDKLERSAVILSAIIAKVLNGSITSTNETFTHL